MSRPKMIVPISQETSGINIMIYGDTGCGKTPFAATAPKCLILDADNGTESAAMHGLKADKWPMRNWDDMEEALDYVMHERNLPYEWVWLDGISLWQDRGLQDIMEDLVTVKKHRKVWQIDRGEYGQNMQRIKTWVRYMSGLPINFGITAHTFWGFDEEGESIVAPWVQGRGMPQAICGYMSIVGYMERSSKNPDNVFLRTRKFGDHKLIRDRYNALTSEGEKKGKLGRMKNPTVPQIVDLIEAKKAAIKPAKKTKTKTERKAK